MLELTRAGVPNAEDVHLLILPDDPIPAADAIVSVGHVLGYLQDEAAIERALRMICSALRPGGVLALDICDLKWGETRRNVPPGVFINGDWVLVSRFSVPAPNQFVREMTTFIRGAEGSWRRDDERHDNVLIDTSYVPELLREYGVEATCGTSFGGEHLPAGLVTVIGRRSR
jgi:hypothetical protein